MAEERKPIDGLDRHESAALRDIFDWSSYAPFWWRAKSMPKLAAKGLVEPHPKGGYRITDSGREVVSRAAIKRATEG